MITEHSLNTTIIKNSTIAQGSDAFDQFENYLPEGFANSIEKILQPTEIAPNGWVIVFLKNLTDTQKTQLELSIDNFFNERA